MTVQDVRSSGLVDLLLDKAGDYLPPDKVAAVEEAYRFAEEAHSGQYRKSGEPFIEHPLSTALYLVDLHFDYNALRAALLHDVVEDTPVTYEELAKHFGEEVATLVDGVTKLTQNELMNTWGEDEVRPVQYTNEAARAASIRKMLMTMAEDVRVVIIKLADRLHNMRTLDSMPENRKVAIAQETLDIYAPLAHRLGMWELKWLLEDLAFQHIDSEAYRAISRLLATKREEREKYIDRVVSMLEDELQAAGIRANVYGRPKHIYSIHRKTEKYDSINRTVNDINDLFALRVIVESVGDCYAALGIVHTMWRPLQGEFDDYIASPKDNMYQSLHTAVLCEDASPVEIQIRTAEMHQLAEYGVAAHWLYKEGSADDQSFEEKMTWLRQILEWQREVAGAEEFVEGFKTDIFQNQVFVYTPKGELKEMPAGATPVDFSYRIHTDVGHRCIGAKVNGKLVPLQYHLQIGDMVEIITSKSVRGPSRDWLNENKGYLKTSHARSKVRQWFNRQERKASVQTGREVFTREIRRLDTTMSEEEIADLMGYASLDDFFAGLGNGSLSMRQVVGKLTDLVAEPEEDEPTVVTLPEPESGIEVLGVGDLLTRMARCCNPIGGHSIIGYITRGRGITVHRRTCPNIMRESESERLVEVDWGKTKTLYPVQIRVESWDRVGLLSDVTSLVADEGVNIVQSITGGQEDDLSIIRLTVTVENIEQLNRLFSKIEGVVGVLSVSRVMG
ncbi:MAG: bifunctional (p)ppGpp synthetase/guanosine-3',5'-bis(diphosphate) 3'-pyrophosphohydrolase [Dehalococcoidia bacterium]|nr:bifunctional (p)ppGpp synthetase/guanosine-3',5'-bis(diphosphate) 3'-pyrophosphohydrolase [Dehalococcoidia bacterium]